MKNGFHEHNICQSQMHKQKMALNSSWHKVTQRENFLFFPPTDLL